MCTITTPMEACWGRVKNTSSLVLTKNCLHIKVVGGGNSLGTGRRESIRHRFSLMGLKLHRDHLQSRPQRNRQETVMTGNRAQYPNGARSKDRARRIEKGRKICCLPRATHNNRTPAIMGNAQTAIAMMWEYRKKDVQWFNDNYEHLRFSVSCQHPQARYALNTSPAKTKI